MNDFDQKVYPNVSIFCGICLTVTNVVELQEAKQIDIYHLIRKLVGKCEENHSTNICTSCYQTLETIIEFVDYIHMRQINSVIRNSLYCTSCYNYEDLNLFPHNLIVLFNNLVDVKFNFKDEVLYLCNKCLNILQNILNFLDISKNSNKQYLECAQIKTESTEVYIKNEYTDDEFIEFPERVSIKIESNIEFEPNNNFIKKEAILNAIDEPDSQCDGNIDILKIDIEEEGIQYDSNEMIPVDCSFCKKPFNTTRDLLNHMKQRFRCRYQSSNSTYYWKNYLKTVTAPFNCQVCFKYFATHQKWKYHIQAHFKKCLVICPFCGKIFIKEKEYLKHFIQHSTKQLPVKCKICLKKCLTKFHYLKHKKKHEKPKLNSLKCKVCYVRFRNISELNKHNSKSKFSCPYCLKQLCIKSQLPVHLRAHTGERPYQCSVCCAWFAHKGNLTKHCRIHTGYKPYSCNICLKSFSRSDYLNKHSITVHSNLFEQQYIAHKNKLYKEVACQICSKMFPSKSALSNHKRVHNQDKKFKCEICSKSFTYKGLLTGHMKTHQDNKPFACSLCPKRFIKRNDLTRHIYTHTKEKKFTCEICYQSFSRKDVLRLHLRGHTGQKPYECKICFKTFVQKSNLTHHRKRCPSFVKPTIK